MEYEYKIAVWNANDLAQHSLELKKFIKLYDIDIILISEIYFTGISHLSIPGYSIYCTKQPNGTVHSDSATIVKSSIKHHVNGKYQTPHIQATSAVIEDGTGHIVVTAIYHPLRHTIKENQFIDFFSTFGNRFIARSNYNVKHLRWTSRITIPRGRELAKWTNITSGILLQAN